MDIAIFAHLTSLALSLTLSGTGTDASRDALVVRSDFWFHWLIGSTLAVAVGVVCEIPECIYECKVWIKHWKNRPGIDNPKRFSIPLSVLGAIIVALGVAVEGIAEYNGAIAETAIRQFDENLTSKAQKEAADANERASKADLKRILLENRIADIFGPRYLTPKQSARIALKLRQLGWLKGIKIDVYVYGVDNPYSLADFEDSRSVAIAVVKTLDAAKMDVSGWLLQSCWGASASNVVVTTTGQGNTAQGFAIGSEIIKAFQPEIGTDPNVEMNIFPPGWCQKTLVLDKSKPNQRKNDATVSIIVGRKVQPILTREMLEPKEQK